MKIVTVIGARPQFIKAAAVSREITKHPGLTEIIVHTGQHHDSNMSEIFFEEMQIPTPAYNLGINDKSHGAMTGQMIEGIEKVLLNEKPDVLFVYGDTNSTIAGALAAKKIHIKVAHVEAGLRSFNMRMPEEINRILTDRISDYLFCPTDTAVSNLNKEGFASFPCKVIRSGDVMLDAAMYYSKMSEKKSNVIKAHALSDFILCTLHRAENTNDLSRLNSIIKALNTISKSIPVVLPLHPRTKKIMDANNIKAEFQIIEPVGYFDMIELLKHCRLVMTDSGGLQKEAFFFSKHCVTLREETEWTELVQGGYNIIAGYKTDDILSCFDKMKNKTSDFSGRMYGDGHASQIIVRELLS